jgi:DNA-binding phage protein
MEAVMAHEKMKRSYKHQTAGERAETDRLAALAESGVDRAEARHAREHSRHIRAILVELRAERHRQGLSLAQMAERAGMDRQNLHRLETDPNANPTLQTLHRLAGALGKSIRMQLTDEAA